LSELVGSFVIRC